MEAERSLYAHIAQKELSARLYGSRQKYHAMLVLCQALASTAGWDRVLRTLAVQLELGAQIEDQVGALLHIAPPVHPLPPRVGL